MHYVRLIRRPAKGLMTCTPHLYLAECTLKRFWWQFTEVILLDKALRRAVAPVAVERGELDQQHAYVVSRAVEVSHAAH